MNESCIHSGCDCSAYKEPERSNSTLLKLKFDCRSCGHFASEHRHLTDGDHYIIDELRVASTSHCHYQIAVADIPMSPVFGCHDPIPLPWTCDSSSEQESGVLCTCPGFQTSSVAILQKFRKFSVSEVKTSLAEVPCVFCHHPLQHHNATIHKVTPFSKDVDQRLIRICLQETARLGLLNENGLEYVHLLTPTGKECQEYFILVGLQRSLSGQMELVVHYSLEVSVKQDIPDTISECVSRIPGSRKGTQKQANGCSGSRRSARLISNKRTPVISLSSDSDHHASLQDMLSQKTISVNKTLNENKMFKLNKEANLFFESLTQNHKWKHHAVLPQELSSISCYHMASVQLSPVCVLLALATDKNLKIFLTAIRLGSDSEVNWTTVTSDHSPQAHITCLSLSGRHGDEGVCLMAGSSSGQVSVWAVNLSTDSRPSAQVFESYKDDMLHQLEARSLVCCLDVSNAQITACRLSPNGKVLSLGSLVGEVFLYSVKAKEGSEWMFVPFQKLPALSCGSVNVLAWTPDSRMLAVGGSDDCIQVLQHVSSPISSPMEPHRQSILNYFTREPGSLKQRFTHTHCLRGHQSFVADVQCVSSDLLISVGWDGQVLYWCPVPCTASHHCSELHIDSDPHGGFKIGPSATVDFLPLSLKALSVYNLLVVIGNRLGGVSVLHYSTNS